MANKELMVTLGLDATSYAQNIKRAKDLNKELDSSWNLLASSSDKFEESLHGLGKKQEYLSKKMQVASNLTDVFAKRIAESEVALKKSREEQELYASKLERLNSIKEKAIEQGKTETRLYDSACEKIKAYTQLYDKASKAVEVNTKKVLEAESGYSQTQQALQELGRESVLTAEKMSAMRADAKIDALTKDVSDLDHKFSLAKTSVANFESTMDGLQKTQDYLNEKSKLTKDILQNYTEELENSSKKVDYYEKELKDVTAQLKDWNEILEETNKNTPEYEEARKEVENLRFEYSSLNKIVEFHKDRMEGLQTQYKSTEKELAQMQGSLDSTAKKMQSMNDKVVFEPLSKKVKELTNDSIKKLESELSKLERDFELLTTSAKGYEKSITGIGEKQTYYNKSLENAKQLFSQYSKELDKTKTKVEDLTQEQKRLEDEIEKQITLLKSDKLKGAEWDKQAKSVESLKKEYEKVNKELDAHKSNLDKIKKGYNDSRLNVAELTNELNKTNKQLDDFGKNKTFDSLDKNIKSVTDKIKILDSQFKAVESTVDKFGKTKKQLGIQTEFYKEKIELLKQQMGNLNTSLNATEKELETLKAKQDDASQSAVLLRVKLQELDKNSPEFQKTLVEIINLESEIEDLNEEIDRNISKHNNLQSELAQTVAETNSLTRETNNLGNVFISGKLSVAGDKIKNLGQSVENVGRALMPVTMAMGALGVGVIKTGLDFTESMSQVKAVMQSTEEEFQLLEDKAREMGSVTVFTAKESADALSYLGLAGYNAQQAMDALPQILQLAQAGAMDLATASDKATDAVASLGYVGDDAVNKLPEFLNKVAQTAVNANTSVEQMLDAFIKVGGQLDNLEIGLDSASAMLGILANRGLKAEEAGNSLNSILINMTKEGGQSAEAMEQLGVSMFDAEGKVRAIEDVFIDLANSLSTLTKEDQVQLINMIGGKTQAKTLQKLMQGMITDTGELTEEYKQLKTEIEKAPEMSALKNMSDTMTDNLAGDLKILVSQLQESFMVIFKEFEPQLRNFVQNLTEGIKKITDKFKELSPEQKDIIFDFAKLVAIAPVVLTAFGGLAKIIGGVTGGVGKLVSGWGKLSTALNGGKAVKDTAEAIKGSTKAMGGISTVGGLASKALGALSTAFGGASLATLGWVAGGATLAIGAGVAIKNNLEKEVVPTVDLFADKVTYSKDVVAHSWGQIETVVTEQTVKISEATQKAVSSYMEMDEGVRTSLSNLYINSTPITDAIANEMTAKFDEMGNTIKTSLQEDCDEEIGILNGFFEKSTMYNEVYEQELLAKHQKYYDDKKIQIEEAESQINDIIANAKEKGRELKQEEVDAITRLQNFMRTEAVKTLSEQEIEAGVILERMKAHDTRMTAEMVSENIKKLNEGRDESVRLAEEEYEKNIATIIKLRDESKSITKEMAEDLIADATRQKEGMVEQAEETRKKALEKVKALGKETYDQVDEDTGKIMNKWQRFFDKWDFWNPKKKTIEIEERTKKQTVYLPSKTEKRSIEAPAVFSEQVERAVSTLDVTAPIPRENILSGYQTSGGYYSPNSMKKTASQTSSNNTALINALMEQNQLLIQLLSIDRPIEVGVNVDGRQVAKASAKYMDSEINLINKRKSRLGGAF